MIVMRLRYLQWMVKKLGYIPKRDNDIFCRLMDAGKIIHARVYSCYKENYDSWYVSIKICMIDF